VLSAVLYLSFTEAPRSEHEGFAYHAHVRLTILDLRTNTNLTIPDNIGVPGGLWADHTLDYAGGAFAPLHTHDNSGIIHIEPMVFRTFTLGDFFNIWGVPLTETCVWTYCASSAPGGGKIPIMATLFEDWLEGPVRPNYLLENGNEILILIGTG
jgi:hypothetical protein